MAEEEWSSAVAAAIRSAEIQASAQSATILSQLLASAETEEEFRRAAKLSINSNVRDERWLGYLGVALSMHKGGSGKGVAFFDLLNYRGRRSAFLANLKAKIVAAEGGDEALEAAIAICNEAIVQIEDNVFSRMQMIEYVMATGRADARDDALRLLAQREQIFGVDEHSKRLRAKIEDPSIDWRSEVAKPKAPTPRSTAGDAERERFNVMSRTRKRLQRGGAAELQLPREIRLGGELKRLEFSLVAGGQQPDLAIKRLGQILSENPTFAYAELLAERHKLWSRESRTLPSFASYFERALSERDVILLQRLTVSYPKLEAMCIIARVAFGDESAFDQVSDALRAVKVDPSPECKTLRLGLESILPDNAVREPASEVSAIRANTALVRMILSAANEVSAVN